MSSSPRERLVEAGTRLLERDGPEALQARKVAAEIGASTMAVYTHFGGMNGLLEAIIAASGGVARPGPTIAGALRSLDGAPDRVLICGSLYLAGEVLKMDGFLPA